MLLKCYTTQCLWHLSAIASTLSTLGGTHTMHRVRMGVAEPLGFHLGARVNGSEQTHAACVTHASMPQC